MKRDGSGYTLSTGKEFYANGGILGVGEDGVYDGYDGILELDEYRDAFTADEAREVAEYAKAMWDAWLERRMK